MKNEDWLECVGLLYETEISSGFIAANLFMELKGIIKGKGL
jgi:hypothetical protein